MTEFDLDLIEQNLYLGCRETAENVEILKVHNITHILTIEERPLPYDVIRSGNFTTKHISVKDEEEEDLLIHLDDIYDFISEGLSKGVVLVHCYVGMSRSATAVIAFMMKKHQLTYEEAFKKVKKKRSIVRPNSGFVDQLKLYEEMGCNVDIKTMNKYL